MPYYNAKYMTIADVVARRLRAGEFQSGEQFYSRDELAKAYHISPGTARAVLRVLEDRGIIACRKGKRPIPAADVFSGIDIQPVCRPVFFRDSCTAETPEYDYVAFCAQNILTRQKLALIEHDLNYQEYGTSPERIPDEVAVVFPPAARETDNLGRKVFHSARGRIDLLIDQAGTNAVSVFTRKAGLDCALHLIRHNIASVIHVTSGRSAFSWFRQIFTPGVLNEYIPECKTSTVVFDEELEMFPSFLEETAPLSAAAGNAPAAVLIDDPYLTDYLSGEIRTGAYRPSSRRSFFGTALNERSMVFPFLDLRLDALATSLVRTAFLKAETPSANLACVFHLIQFKIPGIG